jgi:hypothetical protein
MDGGRSRVEGMMIERNGGGWCSGAVVRGPGAWHCAKSGRTTIATLTVIHCQEGYVIFNIDSRIVCD